MLTLEQTSPDLLLELAGVDYVAGGRAILRDLHWRLARGQHWAVLGGNGAGKTTFLRLVRGELWPAPGQHLRRRYHINGRSQPSPLGFKEHTAYVSAELLEEYQQRGWDLSGLQVVLSGLSGGHLLYQRPRPEEVYLAHCTLERLGLAELAERSILAMSQGQAKRVLLARALVRRPRLLLLDEPSDGLDPASRQELLRSLEAVAQGGTQLLYATHRFDELVPATSHVLLLEQGAIAAQGPKEKVLASGKAARLLRPAGETAADQVPLVAVPAYEYLVRLADAAVAIEGETVLQGLDWEIAPGQNWLLLGPNGAGKTTLLRLLAGDLRPVFGGSIGWFGEPQRPSLWELRRRISLVSAGLQAQHARSQTGLDTVLSGLFGSIGLHRPVSRPQRQAAQGWLEFLSLAELAQRDVTTLSYGQLRKVLIARAMVTDPEMLLLDEPLSGLDADSRAEVAALLGRLAAAGACLVCVTHHPEEVAGFMSHVAVMEGGRLVFQGSAGQHQQWAAALSLL